MPQPRKRRAVEDAAAAPGQTPAPISGPLILTAAQAAKLGVPDGPDGDRLLEDARLLLGYLNTHPMPSADALSKFAEGQWSDTAPDRLNAARAFLSAAKLIRTVG